MPGAREGPQAMSLRCCTSAVLSRAPPLVGRSQRAGLNVGNAPHQRAVVRNEMFAKQIIVSASLVVVLDSAALAQAEPDPSEPVDDEARLQPPGEIEPASDPPPPPRKPTGQFSIGAGFSTDDAFIAKAGISQSNLFGTGNLLALDATISMRRQLFR